ncbi:hypothetical protein [Cerasicoccus maritimus]|uniref:hypothetical protein n=1 Tax=Cerasicoccus maritimus TaxID=490089 RepID=UPI0028526E66|nr:hypothetical protein [Cerasicoccus maritimus]
MESTYGELSGVVNSLSYPDGSPKSCILNKENRIQTPVGEIIPKYREAEFGERQKKHRSSLSFYPSGQLKSAALDQAMPLQTPMGEFKAEFVTFFEDGKINRLFPLNGQIDGFWSEQQEGQLAEVLDFDLPVGKFSAKIISLNFYPSGALKSLTLWPGERIRIETPVGPMNVRTGFSLYENGAVRSVEPSGMAELITPIGIIQASDPEMLGMNADQNSVQFSPEGALLSLKTVHTGICVASEEGETYTNIEPYEAASLIDIEQMRTVPMQIDFSETEITITAKEVHRFDIDTHNFQSFERQRVLRECCGGGCGGGECGGCSGGEDCCQN